MTDLFTSKYKNSKKSKTKWKRTSTKKYIGAELPPQIYPLIFIIKSDTKTTVIWNVFYCIWIDVFRRAFKILSNI